MSKLTPREFFESEWFKDATQKLCADGWPTFVVPLNVKIREALDAYDRLAEENKIFKNELKRIIKIAPGKSFCFHAKDGAKKALASVEGLK